MKKSIFDFPEICHLVESYLSEGDTATCLLVSKFMNTIFTPYLYRSVAIRDYRHYLDDAALNALVQDTQNSHRYFTKNQEQFPGPKISPPLSSLIAYGDVIERLTIFFDEGIDYSPPRFRYLGDDAPKQNSPPGKIQIDTIIGVLQKCSLQSLKSLNIQGFNQKSPYRPYSHSCGSAHMEGEEGLRRMGIRDKMLAEVLKSIATLTSDRPDSPGLQTLIVSNCGNFSNHSLQMIADTSLSKTITSLDISSCGNFRSEEIHFIMSKLPNLEFADFRCYNDDSEDTRESLKPYAGLLTKEPTPIDRNNYDEILEFQPTNWACGNSLRTLRILVSDAVITRKDEDKINIFNYSYNSVYEWLYGARLNWFKRHVLAKVPHPESLFWFYDQIASLTQLRELYIGRAEPFCESYPFNLSLKDGLARWSTLTSLEHVDVSEFETVVNLKDVQWMTENWPALKSIRGLVRGNDEVASEAVLWLKKTRPDIDLPVTETNSEVHEEDER